MDILFYLLLIGFAVVAEPRFDDDYDYDYDYGYEPFEDPWANDPASRYEPEDQTPTGKMTTATEVRPILDLTRPQWIALREYNEQDILYFTHLVAWRCGLHEVRFQINDWWEETLYMEPCHLDEESPNAIKAVDAQPFLSFTQDTITTVKVWLVYDDLGTDEMTFEREAILMQ